MTETVREIVRRSEEYLRGKGVEGGRMNAEYLLAHVLEVDRLDLYLDLDRPLGESELGPLRPLLRRRGAREPLQYVLGSAPFRELELRVDPRVAIPRPETEYLIDVLRREAGPGRVFDAALDVGTGSGAIAISLAAEGVARSVTATDRSVDALKVARANAGRCGHPGIRFLEGSLLEPVRGLEFDLVLSNPPYLSAEEWRGTEPEIRRWEPGMAMVAGDGGLALIRRLIDGLPRLLRPGGWFGVETGVAQGVAVAERLRATRVFEKIRLHADLAGRPRYVLARRIRVLARRIRSTEGRLHGADYPKNACTEVDQ